MTIEERAFKKYPKHSDSEMESEMVSPRRNAYITDCKEQQIIDIDKACDWLFANIDQYVNDQGFVETHELERNFRKMMKE